MAITVIDEKPDPKITRHVTCKKCGVRLEYLPIDVRKTTHRDYTGCSDDYYWVDCPKCKNANSVKPVY